MRTFVLLCVLVLGCVRGVVASPVNLITNGDFSNGATGFTTDYERNIVSGWDEGVYDVRLNGDDAWHPYFVDTGDHTTGTGNFMTVNGQASITAGPRFSSLVWSQTVTGIQQHTDYFFEAFTMNLCCTTLPDNQNFPGPSLSFFINGILLGNGSALEFPGIWTGLSSMWNSGENTAATLEVRNNSSIFNGNDFGLDDLYLGTESTLNSTPEPVSMVLLGSGLLMIGREVRKRQQKTPTVR